jgi:cobalt/nickel transport protein
MKKMATALVFFLAIVFLSGSALAHFGMLTPSDNMVMQQDNRTVTLTLSFSHPFEGQGMILERPKAFGVVFEGKRTDLLTRLQPTKVMGQQAWQMNLTLKRPGIYIFYMEPQPYWEEAEDGFIVHYTKTVVAAFGDDENWDAEAGLKTEIVPLSKPFGLYAGNVFQGIVKLNGKPVPYAEVEIEFYNRDKKLQAPTDYMVTQTIKADGNGVFTYAAPWSGWWGFAALNTADYTIKHNGEEKPVELGAVIWVKFEDPIKK